MNNFHSFFKDNLQKTQNHLKDGEVFIVFASDFKIKNSDVEYKFRQDSNFFYLTGLNEANGILVLKKNYSCLFCLPKDKEKEIWTGKRFGKDAIKEILHLDETFDLLEFDEKIKPILQNNHSLFHFFGIHEHQDLKLIKISSELRNGRECKFGPSKILFPNFFHQIRMKKSNVEIKFIQEAVQITKLGHLEAMRKAKPGVFEYEIEAVLENNYLKSGAWGGGYGHIVASGVNATILHYTLNNAEMKNGELLLIDSGAEKNCYTADVTRTFPVGKKFSDSQKLIYEIVLDVQKKSINQVILGQKFKNIHEFTVKLLSERLLELKLLKGSMDEILENKLYKKYYMHSTSHYLGLDVHDVGNYYLESGESITLEEGQIITIEPGLYFDPQDEEIPESFRGIGIRIEDDILVGSEGPVNLTNEIPKEVMDLEELKN